MGHLAPGYFPPPFGGESRRCDRRVPGCGRLAGAAVQASRQLDVGRGRGGFKGAARIREHIHRRFLLLRIASLPSKILNRVGSLISPLGLENKLSVPTSVSEGENHTSLCGPHLWRRKLGVVPRRASSRRTFDRVGLSPCSSQPQVSCSWRATFWAGLREKRSMAGMLDIC